MENVEDIYTLSPMQQGMLFHTLYTPGSTVYLQQFHWSLHGKLQLAALKKAWQSVLERHPALRTVFVWEGLEKPLQVVRNQVSLPWHFHDWRKLELTDDPNRLEMFLEADREQGFDLTKAPLMRLHLIQLTDDAYHFVWSHHHLLLDGWSLPLVLGEVFVLYEAFSRGQEVHLPVPPPYREYIAWLEQQDESTAERFWRSKLQGFETATSIDGGRKPQESLDWMGDYKEEAIRLSPNTTYALQSLAQQGRITMSTLIQGAWALLLNYYSEQEDVLFGATVSGRPPGLAGIESMVGMFINTLPVRIQVQTESQLIPWLQELQRQLVAQEQYAYTPLNDIQGWSDVPRGKPLFESIIVFENYPMGSQEGLNQLEVGPIQGFEKTNYPLTLTVEPGSTLFLHLDYDSNRFDADTIGRMLTHLQTLLEEMATDPDRLVGNLSFLTTEEQHQLVVGWNETASEFPLNYCIHQLFEAQVARTPTATAVTWGHDALTYDQLNRKANQLAHYLRRQGIESEKTPVAIYMNRSLEQIVSVLAVLKAGGVYIPLDTLYPADRISFMLDDVRPWLILTQDVLTREQAPVVNYPTLCLDSEWTTIAKESEQNPENKTLPHHLAYIIYTSGSTGQPKGVMVEHRNLANAYFAWEKAYELHVIKAHLQMANFTFDVFVGDLVRSLLSGGKLILCPRDLLLMPEELYRLLREEQVECAEFVPVVLRHLVQYIEKTGQSLDFMRLIACGSDYWYMNEYQQILSFCGPDTRLINSYGLTETTIDSTYFECKELEQGENRLVPIGRPFANMQIFILDKQMRPLPVGIPGELYIGGLGVARGYCKRPQLTAERFVRNPFCQEGRSERLYKSGDRARYLPDGNIEFLGRLDHQVKIRGFRVEPGEVEAVLSKHPNVKDTAVLAREDQPGNKRLVGYVVACDSHNPPSSSELHHFLKERLPDYMIPAAFVNLDAFPLTSNGKVNRRALPVPEVLERFVETDLVKPRTPAEMTLVEVWGKVLAMDDIGIHDNFFELGGDSILSIQVVAQANQKGLRFTPRQLFQYQTIAELATVAGTSPVIRAEQGLVKGFVELTPIQRWFFAQDSPQPHHANQAVMLEVVPDIQSDLLQKALLKLLVHHDALRMRYVATEGSWEQSISEPDNIAPFTEIDLSVLPSHVQTKKIELLAAESQASLNLAPGPLMKAVLFRLGANKPARLLLIIHHLVIDGVSWRILLEDIATVYRQLSQREPIQLPPKTTSFKKWARRLVKYGQSESLQSEVNYWVSTAHTSCKQLPLDCPYDPQANTEGSVKQVLVSLTEKETSALLQDVPPVYNTQINDVLLTALALTFSRWAGENKLLVDLEGHGRENLFDDVDISRTVGWFTTVFPVLLEIQSLSGLGETLKSVKEQLREIPNQGIGYGLLRYISQNPSIQSKMCAMPQSEISFNYLGQLDQTLSAAPILGMASESTGPSDSPLALRSYLLEINGYVSSGKLHIDWTYSQNLHNQNTITQVAQEFVQRLRELIAHCQSVEDGDYTPSDFPEAELNQEELDQLLVEIGS